MTTFVSSALAPVLDTGASGHSMGGLAASAIKPAMSRPPQAPSPIPTPACDHSPGVTSPQGRDPLAEVDALASSREALWSARPELGE